MNISNKYVELDLAIEKIRRLIEDVRLEDEDRRDLADHLIQRVFSLSSVDRLFDDDFFSLFDREFGKDRTEETNENIRHKKVSRRIKGFKEVFGYA